MDEAALPSCPWHHIDDTAMRVDGQNQHTHLLCNPLYSIYVRTEKKDRLSVIHLLRHTNTPHGKSRTPLLFVIPRERRNLLAGGGRFLLSLGMTNKNLFFGVRLFPGGTNTRLFRSMKKLSIISSLVICQQNGVGLLPFTLLPFKNLLRAEVEQDVPAASGQSLLPNKFKAISLSDDRFLLQSAGEIVIWLNTRE